MKKEKIKDNSEVILSVIWGSIILGIMSIVGAAWGKLGLSSMFSILGIIAILFLVCLFIIIDPMDVKK